MHVTAKCARQFPALASNVPSTKVGSIYLAFVYLLASLERGNRRSQTGCDMG